jgi:hypothetical protein
MPTVGSPWVPYNPVSSCSFVSCAAGNRAHAPRPSEHLRIRPYSALVIYVLLATAIVLSSGGCGAKTDLDASLVWSSLQAMDRFCANHSLRDHQKRAKTSGFSRPLAFECSAERRQVRRSPAPVSCARSMSSLMCDGARGRRRRRRRAGAAGYSTHGFYTAGWL